jgi:hypothetical protein
MTKVGIVNPNWTLSRHNTDQRCVVDLLAMNNYVNDLSFEFAGSQVDYLQANINFVTERLFNRKLFQQITLLDMNINADVLYKYGGEILGLTLEEKSDLPLISTLGFPTLNKDKLRGENFLEAEADQLVRLAGRSNLVHFHTDCMREHFLTRRPEWKNKCVTIPFFLPHLKIASEESINEKFLSADTRLVFVGNGKGKGFSELCEALDYISDFLHAHNVSMTFVTKASPLCKHFKSITHVESLPRDDVQKLMQASHIYLMVPHQESFGLVFVEAMAAGCAVISDDDVPRQEILDNGQCGRLVKPGDAALIAYELKNLIENRPLTLEFAMNGWRRAQLRYEPKLVARQYADAFSSLKKI